MKRSILALVAGIAFAAPAVAQQSPAAAPTPSTPAASPAPASPSTPAASTDSKPKAKDARKECRESVKSQGLKGEAREKAVSDCFIKQRPDLAAKETARLKCWDDAKAKGIGKGERKDFVKSCMKDKS
jgi:hypothetical protein